jgi:hypothetical protein
MLILCNRVERLTNLLREIEEVLHDIWILNSRAGHILHFLTQGVSTHRFHCTFNA